MCVRVCVCVYDDHILRNDDGKLQSLRLVVGG